MNIKEILGLSFDATCSLVCICGNGNPISVSLEKRGDIIMWMDHRAELETIKINKTHHEVLKYIGGKISPEMELPKLLWLKKNLPESWADVEFCFDLTDYLTWKATGCFSQSLCTTTCKWTYVRSIGGWIDYFYNIIGLKDLLIKIGKTIKSPGTSYSLSLKGSEDLGLKNSLDCKVGLGLIDAHAGGIGVLSDKFNIDTTNKLAIISGTSACLMSSSSNKFLIPGIWGPYSNVMVPGFWLHESGITACGNLLDSALETHPFYKELLGSTLIEKISHLNEKLKTNEYMFHTKQFFVYSDFHGNRNPLGDPEIKGSHIGLTLDKGKNDLIKNYIATIEGLSFSIKHLVNLMNDHKPDKIETIYLCGGLTSNQIFIQILSNVLQISVKVLNEGVLLGSAMIASVASGRFLTLEHSMECMGSLHTLKINPSINEKKKLYYKKKFSIFLRMQNDQLDYRTIMEN